MTHNGQKQVHVQYFAILREERGLSEEAVTTSASTVGALFDELQTRHAFSLPAGRLRAVVNEDFTEWGCPLEDGDTVVFIPPVAGG
jgi:sulfur-carrier protein